ncbi:MAG: DUF268 domain-containing protein [Thermodesulfobacteriota bacterium]
MAEQTLASERGGAIRRLLERFDEEIKRLREHRQFRKQFLHFKSLCQSKRFQLDWRDRHPCMRERDTRTSSFDRHYVYHTAWAARVLARTRPEEHVDISSSLYFAGITSAFIPMRFYDFRPPNLRLDGIKVDYADLLSLPFPTSSIPSLSCMHVVEHIGLGRYGDPLDPEGDLKAIDELIRVTANGGLLLFVVPLGRRKLMFNAHRIYSYEDIIQYFGGLELIDFSLIPEDEKDGGLVMNAEANLVGRQTYGCGCFWFRKHL